MKSQRWQTVLILLAILLIGGFQVYWLHDNFIREKKILETRVQNLYIETARNLQDSIVQSRFKKAESGAGIKKVLFQRKSLTGSDSSQIVGEVIVGRPVSHFEQNKKELITIHRTSDKRDTGTDKEISVNTIIYTNDSGNQMMFKMDSILNDSIPKPLLEKAFRKKLLEQELSIPFTLLQAQAKTDEDAPFPALFKLNRYKRYEVQMGNALPYLFKKLSYPILFSIVLIGLTVLAFMALLRSLKEQRKLATLKNDLISNISHELKTPIATVGVAMEALRNFNALDDPAKTKEYLDISHQELQRLNLLVDKVLKLSIFEKTTLHLKEEPVDMLELVREVTGSLRLQIEKMGAEIDVHAEGQTIVSGDRLHLLSVVFNLLDNALKYSKAKPVIQIELKNMSDMLVLAVKDNGIGIPENYREKVFEKFFRVPQGNTHDAKGYGLGLSYVTQVLQKHRGYIKAESILGQGSSFIVHLPLATI